MATTEITTLASTRRALHVVAEHVLLPDLHDHTGRMGLRPTAGGFGTPPYRHRDGFLRRLRVEGLDVVDERDGQVVARHPLDRPRTLRDLRAALGVTASPPSDIYDLGTEGWPDQLLALDPAAASAIAALFAMAQEALLALGDEARARPGHLRAPAEISSVQLWPERFDISRSVDSVTYGISPGDDAHPEPHLYVARWEPDQGAWPDPVRTQQPARPLPTSGQALVWFLRTQPARLR